MRYKNNIRSLIKFRNDLLKFRNKEKVNISEILSWRKKLLKQSRIKARLINITQCKDWYFDKNKNLRHKSGQFFKVTGVKVSGAKNREVVSWTQPILDQKHGGVLAFICRLTKENGVEFLVDAKTEAGDDGDIKISPSFQATQSNMNRAHGGKLPRFYDIVIQLKGAKLIYSAAHNEEGARFWKKSNLNVIVKLNNPYDKRVYGQNYKWASLSQLKKLSLKNNILNPFVKTILFMI
jgi:oxidase EvaA